MILGNFLKYLFFPYINYLKIILPEHSIDYAWFEQELLLTLWLILLRFFLQNILKSKPICIITDLYHFLIRHTYFSLSQNTYPAPPFFHSASGKGKDYCWCLIHGRSKIVMGGGIYFRTFVYTVGYFNHADHAT